MAPHPRQSHLILGVCVPLPVRCGFLGPASGALQAFEGLGAGIRCGIHQCRHLAQRRSSALCPFPSRFATFLPTCWPMCDWWAVCGGAGACEHKLPGATQFLR
jgi:hypothetical protein